MLVVRAGSVSDPLELGLKGCDRTAAPDCGAILDDFEGEDNGKTADDDEEIIASAPTDGEPVAGTAPFVVGVPPTFE